MRIHRRKILWRLAGSFGDVEDHVSTLLAAGFGAVILVLMLYAIGVARGW
ncbi:MAG: hypothetical protein WCI73_09555 [Phycisphaerae bacterium]